MNVTYRSRRLAALVFGLALAFLAASPAVAQVFKCESHGHVAFQDTPCPRGAAATVVHQGPASASHVPERAADTLVMMPPALDVHGFKPPSSMSLLEIDRQLRLLGRREQALRDGMHQQVGRLRKQLQASIEALKTRDDIMKAWAAEARKSSRRSKALSDEATRRTRAFVNELHAVSDKPLPSETRQLGRAMQARDEQAERIRRKWMPRIHASERAIRVEEHAGERRDQSFQRQMASFDRKRKIRVLRERYHTAVAGVLKPWQSRIRRIEARKKALGKEIRRRCPRGASLSSRAQRCYR